MNEDKQKEAIKLFDELESSSQESSAIRRTKEYVKVERQKNKVQGLEVQSKLKELMDQVKTNDISDFKTENSSNKIYQLDDAATINKTKLNLDVTYTKYEKEESESEESD